MSWLFGIKKDQHIGEAPQFPLPMPPSSSGGSGGKGDDDSASSLNSKMEAYRFDSAALERAAKAAKDLESSSKNNIYDYSWNITIIFSVASFIYAIDWQLILDIYNEEWWGCVCDWTRLCLINYFLLFWIKCKRNHTENS